MSCPAPVPVLTRLGVVALATAFALPVSADGIGPEMVATAEPLGSQRARGADLDGDGDEDLVVAARYDDEIQWYENLDGLGTFGPKNVITGLVDGADALWVADLDGDGDTDVISGSRYDDKVAWYENTDGLGTFGPQLLLTDAADGPSSVTAADVDLDGDLDVVFASRFDDRLGWFENLDGLGTFSAGMVISFAADGPNSVTTADVDGDGDPDVISGSRYDDRVAWYENTDGQGSFGPQRVISDLADHCQMVFAADFDGDGDVDVASASRFDNKVAWYENTDGLGTFGPQIVLSLGAVECKAVSAADLDGDGDQDILSAAYGNHQVAWYENTDGLGTFAPGSLVNDQATHVQFVTTADFDGDGDPDVVSTATGDADKHLVAGPDDRVSWHESAFCGVSQPALEVSLAGDPPNPMALLPGVTTGPVLWETWDPVVDHTSFLPAATLDLLVIGLGEVNLPSPYGTILTFPPVSILTNPEPGSPFAVPLPNACASVGSVVRAQGASLDAGGQIALTNALVLTLGTE